jgi:hypothetical protein
MTQHCENCRFWRQHMRHESGFGNCHRRAPISGYGDNYLHDISKAIKLLLWWNIREWNGDPDLELRNFLLELDETFHMTCWPQTEADDWCGEWEARENMQRAQAA